MKRHFFACMGRVLGREKSNVTSAGIKPNQDTGLHVCHIQGAIVVKISQSGSDTEFKRMVGGREGAIAITKKEPILVISNFPAQVEGAIPVNVAQLQTPQKKIRRRSSLALETFRRRY